MPQARSTQDVCSKMSAVLEGKQLNRTNYVTTDYVTGNTTILVAAGHSILTPANQLMVMGLKIWSLSNPGIGPATFQSLAQRVYQLL
jgi:hypothetical protein